MIYLKYASCDDNTSSRHKAAVSLRDDLLYRAFGIKKADRLVKTTEKGKPYIKDAPFDFSVSHTSSAVLVAACGKGEEKENLICIDKDVSSIGVDIEAEVRRLDTSAIRLISERLFSKRELEYVMPGTAGEKLRFLEIWTRKESIVKAMGQGISAMRAADSFSETVAEFLETQHIIINNQKYIISVAGRKSG